MCPKIQIQFLSIHDLLCLQRVLKDLFCALLLNVLAGRATHAIHDDRETCVLLD
jgi:hypothetical protein